MKLKIFGDNKIEAFWFKNLSTLLKDAEFETIKGRGQNPAKIESLIRYDRPDIILTNNDIPVLVIEKTREVPTGHNVGQRFARLVRAVEEGIPTICFFPFDARKHGKYSGICNLNIRMLKAFERMIEIHRTPIVAVNWLIDEFGELIDDGNEDKVMSSIVDNFIRSNFSPKSELLLDQIKTNKAEYERRLASGRGGLYAHPPKSVEIIKTSEIISRFAKQMTPDVAKRLNIFQESVIYIMGMTPDKCRREDPYTGTQFIYDYLWCRVGPSVENKNRNLILHFPNIDIETWYSLNPNDNNRKSCNWYLTASALIFEDKADYIRN